MALPFLYSPDDSTNDYSKNGLGALPDCSTLLTTGAINGEVVLQGSIPVGKSNVDNLINGNIIKVKINDTQQPQIMRLFNVKKSMANGLVTFSAEPISNDIRENFLPSFEEGSKIPELMFEAMRDQTKPAIPSRFHFYSDKEASVAIKLERVNALQALGGVEGSFLQKYKGEYEKDNHDIHLHTRLGEDHKIKILYTKNLTGLDIEVDTQGIVNGIYAYAKLDGTEDIIEGTKQITYFEKQYNGGIINPIDFSNDKPETSAELQKLADAYIAANKEINTPKVTAKIDFILLNKQPNYREFVNMETVGMGDGVDVYHPGMDVDLHARVVSYEYDSLSEQYTKLEIGSVKSNFINQIVDKIDENNQEFDDKLGLLDDAQQEASDIIKNPGEGHVVIYPSLADPQEILIMDTTDVNTAQHVWRFNEGGLAFSRTGYNGTYELAMTNNGAIVADRITTGVLRAINIIGVTITGSVITSSGDDYKITLDNGKMTWFSESKKKDVISMESIDSPQTDVGVLKYKIEPGGGFQIVDTKGNLVMSTYDNGGDVGAWLSFAAANFFWNNKDFGGSVSFSASGDSFNIISKGTSYTFSDGNINTPSWALLRQNPSIFYKGLRVDMGGFAASGGTKLYDGATISGGLSVSGTKSSLVQTESFGERLLYAFETPEYLFATYGKAVTNEDGYVEVEIEPMFLETINTDSKNYHVFVSPYENSTAYACYLEKDRFLIKSDKPNIEVSWQLVAYRKGYEEFYLETPESNSKKLPDEQREEEQDG